MRSKEKFYIFILLVIGFNIAILFPKTYSLFSLSKQVDGSIVVPENNYCINNGFNKLGECVLVMENYSNSVDSAKSYISSKRVASFENIAPATVSREVKTNITSAFGGDTVLTTSHHFNLGKSYRFDSASGVFYLEDTINHTLTDDYINYYTCGSSNGVSEWKNCPTMYQIKSYKVENGVYTITEAVQHSSIVAEAINSEIGLYAAEDDLGTSYYYRGNVKNNYVSFAGYIWRIIRVNGNGTVRMIYSGSSTSAVGHKTDIGTSPYNSKDWDPTYMGYKYSEDFALDTTNTETTEYTNFSENTTYYFGSSYTFDESTKKFQLSGDTVSGKFKDIHNPVDSTHPYTCFSTSSTGTCNYIVQIKGFTNNYTARVSFISYSSKNYEATLGNTTNSTIKGVVDTWYEAHLLNKYDNYLSDEVFCNDRSVASGSGYQLTPTTLYGAYNRLASKREPSLKCSQNVDKFTTASGILKYPIGLITADEVSYAGGVLSNVNTQFYLYTGSTYWTFSPSSFHSSYALATAWHVDSTGSLRPWAYVSHGYGVRPVINLKADVLISGGDGSTANPYVVKLDR